MAVDISYNGSTITSLSGNGIEVFETQGKFLSDDITVTYGNVDTGPKTSDAILTVTVAHGSSVVAGKVGITGSKAPLMWTTSEDSSLDTAIFTFDSSLFDSDPWLITASLGGVTRTKTIVIDSNSYYTMNLVQLYLYKDGDEYTSYTGGWSKISQSGTTVTKNANNIYMRATNAGSTPAAVQTENPLDCTRYSTLNFIVTDQQAQQSTLGLVSVKGSFADSNFVALETISSVGASYSVTVSISNLTGSYYPTVRTKDYNENRFYIHRIWAEC